MSFEQVEECWELIDKARDYAKGQAQKPDPAEYWDRLFRTSDQVDVERSLREGGSPPTRVFLKSPYGLQWRPEYSDWIPFRHGNVVLPPLDLD